MKFARARRWAPAPGSALTNFLKSRAPSVTCRRASKRSLCTAHSRPSTGRPDDSPRRGGFPSRPRRATAKMTNVLDDEPENRAPLHRNRDGMNLCHPESLQRFVHLKAIRPRTSRSTEFPMSTIQPTPYLSATGRLKKNECFSVQSSGSGATFTQQPFETRPNGGDSSKIRHAGYHPLHPITSMSSWWHRTHRRTPPLAGLDLKHALPEYVS